MKGSVFFLLGGAAGIGEQVARQAAVAGAKLAICDIKEEAGTALAHEVGGSFFYCNAANAEGVKDAVSRCATELGTPTYAHLNSGVMTVPSDAPFTPFEEAPVDAVPRQRSIDRLRFINM
ncbi:SDR family oxidoreductase [Sphingorhabdus sp. 109]|jgi:NAD(P)-dependent dehydrogenase (short-subunit alcohol dehydrogenase family)|uniref:SDR family oxidoreductase n=1 Tax=Sphingorhabdus sp. 109 TaxID=2653173 RepID=UPI0012F3A127